MKQEIQATIVKIDSTDVLATAKRIEALYQQAAEKEQAADKARKELETAEQIARKRLERFPELLAEFNAEMAELAQRRAERSAREARVTALRKQAQR